MAIIVFGRKKEKKHVGATGSDIRFAQSEFRPTICWSVGASHSYSYKNFF